ncbi:WXG100 family type VII secretion target [Clostridium felsineum]|uniref:WXG100 family type VII secretion target n=1 Tax=Clostridium felsineum TaxID=36839 RepID=UPI00098CDBE3|nr:WXG100 family type VII secretion target [Clostridium felsineum]URZ03944.1 hypothetical protein CLAUR_040100 [Clostridium felsineum]
MADNADQIQVGTRMMLDLAKKFKDASNTAKNSKGNMQKVTDRLINGWNGKAVKEFENTYKILYQNMNTYSDALDTLSKNLEQIAKAFNDSDTAIANGIKGQGGNGKTSVSADTVKASAAEAGKAAGGVVGKVAGEAAANAIKAEV